MTRKIIPYILILITLLVGFFSPVVSLRAADPLGTCTFSFTSTFDGKTVIDTIENYTEKECKAIKSPNKYVNWTTYTTPTPTTTTPTPTPTPTTPTEKCTLPKVLKDGKCVTPDTKYILLSPLPCEDGSSEGCVGGELTSFDPTGDKGGNLGKYLNIMIRIFIGICAVLAVMMIVVGGIEYMTTDLLSSKEQGRHRISGAIFGLLLALGSWVLLNQINPDLLKTDLESLKTAEVIVTLDQQNFAKTEQNVSTAGTGYKLNGTPSSGVSVFAQKNCSSLNKITVNTSSRQANFCAGTNCVSVPINIGYNGVSQAGQAQNGDGKTPKGTFTVGGDRRLGSNGNAVISLNGYNLGAAFINIGATINGSDRGIGFHGSANNALGTTNGCIRMTNDDLALLAPCMKSGTTIIIN